MLPSVESLDAYRLMYQDAELWLPAMRAICQRHGLDAATLRLAPPGSHVVFWVETDQLIKLFAPLWPEDAATETLALRALAHQSDFRISEIRAEGLLEGWPYLVLTRLPGQPLDTIWDTLGTSEREQVAVSLGHLMAALHRVPTPGLDSLLIDWAAFLTHQFETCVARQAEAGASPTWLAEIAGFLADLPPLFEPDYQPVVLNADLNPEHLFCEQKPEGWRVTGVIDFGDAMLGHPYYEFVAPGFIFKNAPALRRAMLEAYGFAPFDLDENLSRTLLAYTLLHRFANIPDWLEMFGDRPPADLTAMEEALWTF